MRSKLGQTGCVAAVVVAFAMQVTASDVKVEGDLKKMQGEWTATLPNGDEVRYTIKGDRIKAFAPNEEVEVTITLDPDAKPHKMMDGKLVGGGDDGRSVPAIYRFQGDDALVISYCPAEGAERPKDFEPRGDGQVVVTLVRKMAKGADAAKPADAKAAAKVAAELKKLQGEWAGTARNGDEIVYVFAGDRLTAGEPGGEIELTIKIDPSARPNKAMDGTVIGGGDAQQVPAIYKFDGDDKLVICFQHGAGAKRPREFEDDGDHQHVAKLTRRPGGGAADLKKLQGAWTTKAHDGSEVVFTFKGDKVTVKAPTRTYEMTVALGESDRPERTIDFKIDQGPDDAKGKTSPGIYKFDADDALVVCLRPTGDRPTKFERVGEEQFVMEFKRQK
jgi:uncharacterized protein (TIGR03067 family)